VRFQEQAVLKTNSDLAVMGQHHLMQGIGNDGYSMYLGSYPIMPSIRTTPADVCAVCRRTLGTGALA
jgi:hypothetical protein